MVDNQVIFVRGGKTQPMNVWRYFHFHPSRDVSIKSVKLVYFDFVDGTIKIWNKWSPNRGRAPQSPPDQTNEIKPKINIRFSDGSIDTGPKLPSVLSLYDYVKKQPKDSIWSFHIFSHGYYDGPIIWADSYELNNNPNLTLPRDAHDSEFRRRDFFGHNPLAGAEGKKFARAFAPGAFVKIWGCNEDSTFRVALIRYLKEKNTVRQNTILEGYLDAIQNTYALSLSRLLNEHVWAAPVGWGTNPYSDTLKYKGKFPPNLRRELWWRIPAFTPKFRRFYKRILNAQLDATHYIGYHQTWYQRSRNSLSSPASAVTR